MSSSLGSRFSTVFVLSVSAIAGHEDNLMEESDRMELSSRSGYK